MEFDTESLVMWESADRRRDKELGEPSPGETEKSASSRLNMESLQ
jgi:hypothetical protein